ncbi:hypothetical protein [Streptococcus cristatus]|uniref:hypothetical protein n=1 Tax=Streptococcus cristatus TaxID=45634 RepID=UPI0028D88EEE|nr:hypothetical protein [Streptococcus cristatus]
MATKQSKEVKIQREVEVATSYGMEFVTQNESVNPEIDKALSKASSVRNQKLERTYKMSIMR